MTQMAQMKSALAGVVCRLRGHRWRCTGIVTDAHYRCRPVMRCTRCGRPRTRADEFQDVIEAVDRFSGPLKKAAGKSPTT